MTAKKTQDWRKVLPKRIGELQRTVEKEAAQAMGGGDGSVAAGAA